MNSYNDEDYFSDDKSDIENPEEVEQEDEEYEIDDETRRIIWEASQKNYSLLTQESNINSNQDTNNNNKKNTKKQKPNNKFSLNDFNKNVEKDEEAKKPKKFVSKRMNTKKKEMGITEVIEKRKFNPRLPPYNFVKVKSNEVYEINNEEFPTL
jgi:hypothetical protein